MRAESPARGVQDGMGLAPHPPDVAIAMRHVVLDSLYLHHFKSFAQPTEVTLSQAAGLKFLGGRNLVQPRLGSNGAGKSTLWDALAWCLFGTGVRAQRASELATWGEKQPHVMATLRIDDRSIRIERKGSPNRLLIDGEVARQEDVEQLIGLSRDRFLHSVVFGQGVPLFLDISPAARGELLDSVLDLGFWLELSETADNAARHLKHQLCITDESLAFERGHLEGLPDPASVQGLYDDWESKHRATIEGLLTVLEEKEAEASRCQIGIEKLMTTEPQSPEPLAAKIDRLQEKIREVSQLRYLVEFYQGHQHCPTCQHELEEAFIADKLRELRQQMEALGDLSELQTKLTETQASLDRTRMFALSWTAEKAQLTSELRFADKTIRDLAQQVEEVGEEVNPFGQNLADLKAQRAAVSARIADLEECKTSYKGNLAAAEFWKAGFKKVRLFQVAAILTRLEVETANMAYALGIRDWRIRYVTETETKAGTLRPGIQVLVSTPAFSGSWEGFSGGETQRVRLAVTLALAGVIQGLAGVFWQLEVWDEASAFLSAEGIEDLLTCLVNRAELTNKSIFVSDHTQLAFGAFAEIWRCSKTSDGSRIELLTPIN